MKRKVALGLVVLCVIIVAGLVCYGRQLAGSEETSNVPMETVVDSAGREVEIPVHPQRVVILNASNVDLYVAAGGAEEIVGKASSQAYSERVLAATSNAVECGIIHNPSVETILSQKPDLIIGANVPFHQALAPLMATAGVPVYLNSLNSFDELYHSLEFFGQLTGHENLAQQQIAELQAGYKQLLASVQGKNPPKGLIVFGSPESFSMATSKTFSGDLFKRLGGSNLADSIEGAGAYVPLSMEFLAKENPEVIFLIMMGDPVQMQEKVRQELAGNPAWAGCQGVKNNRMYILPYNLFTVNPGIQAIEAMGILAKYMYP